MDLLEKMSFSVLVSDGLFGIDVGVRHLGGLAGAADLDTHKKGDPDSRNDAGHDISVPDGEEETLNGGLLRGEEVVKGWNTRGESWQGDASGHVCEMVLRDGGRRVGEDDSRP